MIPKCITYSFGDANCQQADYFLLNLGEKIKVCKELHTVSCNTSTLTVSRQQ